jgi:ketosteroid isomerase-like protein
MNHHLARVLQLVFVGAACLASSVAIANTLHSSCQTPNDADIARLHRDWILIGWEKKEGDPPFVFRQQLAPYYDFSEKDLILYDDFDPQHRVARTADAWGDVWNQPFNTVVSAHHKVLSGPDILRSGLLAASYMTWAARLTPADRSAVGIRSTTSLVWRCGAGGWKIAREHTSSVRVDASELRRLMGE